MTELTPAPLPPVDTTTVDAVARLERQVKSARTMAFAGVALGLVSIALAAFGLSRTPTVAVPAQAAPAAAGAAATTKATQPAQAPATIGKPADAGAPPAGTIVLAAQKQGAPVLDIFEDFQCPACASVEKTLGPQVKALVASGQVEVRFHMMSFLDENLRNDSSKRAANGGFCANEQGKFLAWHDALFSPANHPAKEGDGWTDAQLKALAGASGLDVTAWAACVASNKHTADVTAAEQTSLAAGVNSTPSYKLNGTALNLNTVMAAGGLQKFIAANG